MLIRQDFNEQQNLPPRPFLEQVMDNLSRFYCFLWDRKNDENKFQMTWKDVCVYYNKNAFRSNLRKLNRQGLLSYKEASDGVAIELVGWDEVFAEG